MPEDTDSYYAADQAPDQAPDQGKEAGKPTEEKQPEAETALLPKSLFPGEPPAIGDVCQFKVEHIWEKEVEVSYVKEGEGEEKPASGPSAMDTATDAFDKIAGGGKAPE